MTHPIDPSLQCEFAVDVVRQLTRAGFRALWAGGCVRDLLMGKSPKDFDVATSATPVQVRALFGERKTIPVGESFGVIIVLGPRGAGQVEVATFRTDGSYSDGRRPDQVVFSTPEEDAARRDFTINGMFYDPLTETVSDYVGGQADLEAGIIRAIGNARQRFAEDKLRMLRAVRFAAHLDFEIDDSTVDAVRDMAGEISVVSAERITQELTRMLTDRHRRRAIHLCRFTGLLSLIIPELAELLQHEEASEWNVTLAMLDELRQPTFELALALLLRTVPFADPNDRSRIEEHGHVAAVCRRLKLANKQTDRVCWLVGQQSALRGADQLRLSTLKRTLAHPGREELLELTRVAAVARGEELTDVEFVRSFLQRTPAKELDPPPLLTGNDLIQLKIEPGPKFADYLELVRIEQLEGRITSRDEAIAFVCALISPSPKPQA